MLEKDGGYVLQEGYWWNRGLVQYYFREIDNSFFLPCKTENSYVTTVSSLYSKTVYAYDRYCLAPITATKFLTDDITNVSIALMDYTVLSPKQITDINDNASQVFFDPLGMDIATSAFGTTGGKTEGDRDLKEYRAIPPEDTTFDDVLANPDKYLQEAATFFYYDLTAWENKRQPARSVKLLRETHVSALPEGKKSRIQVQINYTCQLSQASSNLYKRVRC